MPSPYDSKDMKEISKIMRTPTPYEQGIGVPKKTENCEIHESEDEIMIVTRMPSLGEWDIKLSLKKEDYTIAGFPSIHRSAEKYLVIKAESPDGKYENEVELPCPVKEITSHTHRNGVLEVHMRTV